jgi:SAM-dependent methyltransferase
MKGYGPETWGDNLAGDYDSQFSFLFDVEATVDFLSETAGPGPALELGIGTGRVALPLAARGLQVHGIDASSAMLDALRAKPGGEDIVVTFGDFGASPLGGPYGLVFVVFNTLFALTTQEQQVDCFANVAAALHERGCFVIEAFVPDQARFQSHQRVGVNDVGIDYVNLETTRHDPVGQSIEGHTILINERGIRMQPVYMRYSWPTELDLMARLAGLRLRERWGSWAKEPFTSDSMSHISVYEPAP